MQMFCATIKRGTRALAALAAVSSAVISLATAGSAQQIVDPSAPLAQQPQIGRTDLGTPQIDIATPDHGVSHNMFKSFDVDSHGVILNNSVAAGTSRAGSAVGANANLIASGPANVIVSEVTGTGGSTLAGAVEIFGSRADFILANPNGITCNGCSVLNAGRATLATGTPSIANGRVTVNVNSGALKIGGDGFSAPDGDASLVGRHVFLNAKASAFGDLFVSGGAQVYDGATARSRAAPMLSSRESPYAVDATALGAMTAGQIRILGNEAGLGVRTSGKIKATKSAGQSGNVTIAASGDVTHSEITADGSGTISGSGTVTQSGVATFGQAIAIKSGAYRIISGATLTSPDDIAISADGQIAVEGEVSGRNVSIDAGKGVTNTGFIMADANAQVVAGEAIENNRQKIAGSLSNGSTITRVDEHASRGGTISGAIVALTSRTELRNVGGLIAATADLSLASGTSVLNTYLKRAGVLGTQYDQGELLAGGKLSLTASGDIVNEASVIAANGDLLIVAGGAVKNQAAWQKTSTSETKSLAPGSYYSVTQSTQDETFASAKSVIASFAGRVSVKAAAYEAIASDISSGTDITLATSGDVRLGNVKDTLVDTQATTYVSSERYCTASARGGCFKWGIRYNSSTNTTSTSDSIVLTSNLIGRDVTIEAAKLDAPGLKIAAERDLSIKIKQPLVLKPEIAGDVTAKFELEGFLGKYGADGAGANDGAPLTLRALQAALIGTDAADLATQDDYTSFANSQRTLRAVASLSSLGSLGAQSGAEIKSAARRVGAQAWNLLAGSQAADQASVVKGEQSFSAAVLAGAATQPVTPPSLITGLAWRYTTDDGLAQAARSPGVILHAGRDLVVGVSEGSLDLNARLFASRDVTVSSRDNLAITGGAAQGRDLRVTSIAGGIDVNGAIAASRDLTVSGRANVALTGGTAQGRDVLIASSEGAVTSSATLAAGRDLAFSSRASITVAGLTSAGRDLYLTTSTGGLSFTTNLETTRDLVIDAYGTVRNQASLKAGQSLSIVSRTGNIETIATRSATASTPAQLIAGTGGLVLNAKSDIVNIGSTIQSAGSMMLTAGGDLRNETDAFKYVHQDYHRAEKDKKWYGKTTYIEQRIYGETAVIQPALVTAGGDLVLSVGRDLINIGGTFRAGRTLDATIGRDIVGSVASVELNFINYYSKSSSFIGYKFKGNYGSSESNSFSTSRAEFAGGDINLTAGGDFTAHGATLSSSGSLSLKVAGEIGILPVQQVTYELLKSGKKSTFNSSKSASDTRRTNTQITSLDTTRDLSIVSTGSDITIQAGKLTAGGDLTIVAEKGRIAFLTATGTEYQQIKTDSSNLLWWQQRDSGTYLERIIQSHLAAGGKLTVKGAGGVIVEYQEGQGAPGDVIRALAKSPELAWMGELRTRNDVQWRGVSSAFEQWDHKSEGLTQGGAAVIALAVTVASQGTATGFASGLVATAGLTGTSAAAVLGPALQAGFQSLVSRAAVSLANNKGDVGKVLKELGSSSAIKSIATSMVTAGLVTALPVDALALPGIQANSIMAQVQTDFARRAIEGSIRVSLDQAMRGGKFGEGLGDVFASAAISSALSLTQSAIGSYALDAGFADGSLQKVIMHAGAGAIAAKLNGANPTAGALAGALSELTSVMNTGSDEQQVQVAKMIGAITGLLVAQDANSVYVAADIAGSAQAFNRQLHREEVELIKSNAAAYAVQRGFCSSREECSEGALYRAQAELIATAMVLVDDAAAKHIILESEEKTAAQAYLVQLGGGRTIGSTPQKFFTATAAERANPILNQSHLQQNRAVYDAVSRQYLGRREDPPLLAMLRLDGARAQRVSKDDLAVAISALYGGDEPAFQNDVRSVMSGLMTESAAAAKRFEAFVSANPDATAERLENNVDYITLGHARDAFRTSGNLVINALDSDDPFRATMERFQLAKAFLEFGSDRVGSPALAAKSIAAVREEISDFAARASNIVSVGDGFAVLPNGYRKLAGLSSDAPGSKVVDPSGDIVEFLPNGLVKDRYGFISPPKTVLTETQARRLTGDNRGVIFVTESPRGSAAAQEFQAGTPGAFSNLQTRSGAVPALRYDNGNANGVNYVKFDGYELSADGSKLLLIDAKTKLATWSDPVRTDLKASLERVRMAAQQNPDFKVVYEFPTTPAARSAAAYLDENGFSAFISVRVRE